MVCLHGLHKLLYKFRKTFIGNRFTYSLHQICRTELLKSSEKVEKSTHQKCNVVHGEQLAGDGLFGHKQVVQVRSCILLVKNKFAKS